MRNRMLGRSAALLCGLCWVGLVSGSPAAAAVVNVDLEGDPPDTTHSGSDGVLSGGGSVWNGVVVGVDALDLLDEGGSPSGFDLVFASTGTIADGSATNDLQDSGGYGTFDIVGLSSGAEYDLAIYAFPFSFIAVTDSTGVTPMLCTMSPTYLLPGTLGLDYCLLEDVMPADLGGGDYGFTISGADGAIMGVQLAAPGASNPPAVPALPLPGMVALGLCLLATANRGRGRKRERQSA